VKKCLVAGCEKWASRRGLCWAHEFSQRYQTDPRFRENRKKTKREYNRKLLRRYQNETADALGGWKCAVCGDTDRDVLAFDHERGGGEDERGKMGGQLPTIRYYYHNLGEAKKRLQVLCANCNWKKNVTERYGISRSTKALYERRLRARLMGLLGGWRCRECGETDPSVLTIDHVNGGGAEERRQMNGYPLVIRYYLSHPNEAQRKLQILCRSCNWKKHLMQGVRTPQVEA
jgi:rubrerythrin